FYPVKRASTTGAKPLKAWVAFATWPPSHRWSYHTGAGRKAGHSAPSRQNRKENDYGGHGRHHAAIARGRSAFRSPDPPLESQDEAVYLRRPERGPHHRPVAECPAVRARARLRPADRRPRRQGAVRRHQ